MKLDKAYNRISQSVAKDYIEDVLEEAYGERDIRKISDPTVDAFISKLLPKLEQKIEDALVIKLLREDRSNLLSFLQARGFLDAFPQEGSGTT